MKRSLSSAAEIRRDAATATSLLRAEFKLLSVTQVFGIRLGDSAESGGKFYIKTVPKKNSSK